MLVRHVVVLPELGLGSQRLTLSVWHVARGAEVVAGDRLLEIAAGSVVVDLPAPHSGRVARRLVGENDELQVGQRLAIIESESDPDEE
jgi:pyruvate/2-oxoglutarate dehydrogenase complex dihydrolipoamide acyltransferase (E2) component